MADRGDWPPFWQSLTLMFQREVAERIGAKPGTEAYGRLSVLAQWRTKAKILFDVSRSAFVAAAQDHVFASCAWSRSRNRWHAANRVDLEAVTAALSASAARCCAKA